VKASDKKPNKQIFIGRYLNLGMQLAIGVALGFAFGYWLDVKLNTIPLFTLIGLFVGAAAGFLNIYRAVYPVNKKSTTENEKNHDQK